ncbi:MAG: hypothetical protein Q9176_007264 [Flavoplaca citrina]
MDTNEADARPPLRDGRSKYHRFVKAIFLCLVSLALCLGTLALCLRLFNSQSSLPGFLPAMHKTPCQQTTVVPLKLPPVLSNYDQSRNTPFVECLDDKRWKPSPSYLDLKRAHSSLQFDIEAFNEQLSKRLLCAVMRFVSSTDGDLAKKPALVEEVSSASKNLDLLMSNTSHLEILHKEASKSAHACISKIGGRKNGAQYDLAKRFTVLAIGICFLAPRLDFLAVGIQNGQLSEKIARHRTKVDKSPNGSCRFKQYLGESGTDEKGNARHPYSTQLIETSGLGSSV